MKHPIISPMRKLEFAHYRKIRATSAEVFEYFGYKTENKLLKLPFTNDLAIFEKLKDILRETILHIDLKTERANREFVIAPIMLEILRLTKAKLRANYWFEINSQLKGYLSYFFRQDENILLVESAELNIRKRKYSYAKNIYLRESGMNKSFTQLGVEMIALNEAEERNKEFIYGLLTNGNTWQFSMLNRNEKTILLDLRTFDIFADFEDLIKTLVGILERK
jgi:hypothetical protein